MLSTVCSNDSNKGAESMSVLCSRSFGLYEGYNDLPVETLELFLGVLDAPEKQLRYAGEIVKNSLKGKINHNKEFDIEAYENTIEFNQYMKKEDKRKKESFIDFTDTTSDWDTTSYAGGIKVDVVSANIETVQDAYEELLANNELTYAIETLRGNRGKWLLDLGVDIVYAIQQALAGVKASSDLLRNACVKCEEVADCVKAILESGQPVGELLAEI